MSPLLKTSATVGNYTVVDFMGAGGMGEVYRAVNVQSSQVVALKILRSSHTDSTVAERFLNEAKILAQLDHPNIAKRCDFFYYMNSPCIVMEIINGDTLNERTSKFGLRPVEECLEIFRYVAEAISYCHDHKIIHRDIKSNNIKVNEFGQVKLLDFGIAKTEHTPRMTETGNVIGTLEYLSPELLRGAEADKRSDIWALGVLLYEMLTGQVPFKSDNIAEMVEKVSKGNYIKPSAVNSDVSEGVEAIIAKCLKKNPVERYQSAREIIKDINSALQQTNARESDNKNIFAFAPKLNNKASSLLLLPSKLKVAYAGILLLIFVLIVLLASSIVEWNHNNSKPMIEASIRSGSSIIINIDTIEGSADVYMNGKYIGATPLQLYANQGDKVRFQLKRDGFETKEVELEAPKKNKEFTFTLNRLEQ